MTRAMETCSLIQKHLSSDIPLTSTDLLREGAPIPPDPPSRRWKPDLYQFYRDGARIEAAFRQFFHRAPPEQKEDSYEIIVCHANVIRYFVMRALQLSPEAWLRLKLDHASITSFAIFPNGRVILHNYSNSGYMPPDAISS
ncbi:serine/threonine-protein phosphatase PGAM5, mitochondrial-like [Adelges cooleyi]|uniref:serine/threonine-protein phosphatase PGAM5, mitochondrial-like n=1 Tax=Adelges cooleyi TaxID=133065 RepID=UPI00218069AD|nr:serine/threonine-protein phosphatase PGAM5, mitochondrial-like [Adelges cooleyi]